MNHAVGVDASLAVKWVVDEEHTDRAQQLWADSLAARRPVVAPPHFTGEVTSALYQRTRRADPAFHLTVTEAGDALREFLAYPVEVVTLPTLYEQAFTFAHTHGLASIYVCLYVVCAQLLNMELWTADQRLLTTVGGIVPWVRFIGDYPP
ncbi:MAG: type II toxin-antitoxin system VapC family toxin [Chloroflexi bacterium]|nr:type II toxin-antitoxin system VapC family toxin [Chloroflexota bacterium]